MGDLLAYSFISIASLLNLILLLNSKEYNKCNKNQGTKLQLVILFSLYLHYFNILLVYMDFYSATSIY